MDYDYPQFFLPPVHKTMNVSCRDWINQRLYQIKSIKRRLEAEESGLQWMKTLLENNIDVCSACEGAGIIKYLISESEYATEKCRECGGKLKQ